MVSYGWVAKKVFKIISEYFWVDDFGPCDERFGHPCSSCSELALAAVVWERFKYGNLLAYDSRLSEPNRTFISLCFDVAEQNQAQHDP